MRRAGSIVLGLVLVLGAAPARAQSIFDVVTTGTPGQVRALAARDASLVNVKDAAGKTPLHHAAIVGSVPMIECLLSLGAAIDAANTENLTPLLEAVRSGKDAAANALIEKGARIDGVLHAAARYNRAAVIGRLIATGADIEARDPQGYTPLTAAARMGGPFESLELLVKKGANFNAPDSLGNTPLDNAIIYGGADDRTIDLLLARSAAVNTEPAALASTLSAAARRGHGRLFGYYMARGGESLLATESNRGSVMRSATIGGSLEIVKALRARGIPLDLTPNRNGATPLHSLASNPKALDMIDFLVRNGAEVNARTNDGRSAYNIAGAAGNREAAAILLELGASPDPQQFPRLTGPYLGQTPPGDTLTPFAPGIVYLDHGTVSVSPDGQEMYWPTGTAIMMTRILDGRWTKPAFAPFSEPSDIPFHDDVPFVTPDNKRLFFTSKRAVGAGAPQKENIWFVERTATGWSAPRSVGPAVNAMGLHWQVSVSNTGTLYFGGRSEKDGYGGSDLYCSRLVNGEYTAPVNLGPAINTKEGESQPFIAPDESFILFFRAPGQVPSAYASFKGRDGRWLPAVKFDLPWAGAGLIVSPDGKYLFAGGQWKSARFLEELKRRVEAETTNAAAPAVAPSDGIVAEIPITVERNKTIVPVTAAGSSLRLILDSGHASDGILIFRRNKFDTAAFGPSRAAVVQGAGSGAGSDVLVFESASFTVGTVSFANQRAVVMAGASFQKFPTDGVIGHSLLGHYAVELDYDRNVMTLHDSLAFRVKPGWESLPITFKNNRIPWVDVEVTTEGEPAVRLAAYVDSASGEAIELLTRDANKFRSPAVLKERYLGRGLSGNIYGKEGTIATLRLGSHELTDVVAAIVPAAARSRQDGADAVLANNVLRRFNVVFDYAHGKLHIKRNSHFREPFAAGPPDAR